MTNAAVFHKLAALLRPYASNLSVKADTDRNYYLEESRSTGKPQMFAAVQAKTSYVSLHLYPVYIQPDLLDHISPALRSRMQGKSCFNFKRVDQVPEEELAQLIKLAHETITPQA